MSDMLQLVGARQLISLIVTRKGAYLARNVRHALEPLAKIHLILPELQLGVHGPLRVEEPFQRFNRRRQ
jgi:hypothetical protein